MAVAERLRFILICAQVFGLAFRGLGGEGLVHRTVE
jgi:TRAP-type mannitol/chloroaromatic compound transport system permease large subunit